MALAPRVQRKRKRDASETLDFGVYWLHGREVGNIVKGVVHRSCCIFTSPLPPTIHYSTSHITVVVLEALLTGIFGGRVFGTG